MKSSSFLSALALSLPSAMGATIAYEAVDHPYFYSFNIQGISSNPGGRFSNAASSSYIGMTLDTTAGTIAVDEMSVLFTEVRKTFSQNVTTGFGQSAVLNFDFTARPFGFRILGGAPVSLTPGTDGNYTAGSFATAAHVSIDPIIIDYTITDPATGETVTGTTGPQNFSQTPHSATLNVSGTLNASGYPDQLLMDRITINAGTPGPGLSTITRPIAGGTVSFDLSFGYFNINPYASSFDGNDNRITFNRVVPEPALAGLFGIAALACASRRPRRAA